MKEETATKYHNALGGHGAEQLCAYIARIERLEAEVAGLNDDKRDVYGEAKACGFDKMTMRKVIARRRRARSDLHEEDSLVALYEEAIASIDKVPDTPTP